MQELTCQTADMQDSLYIDNQRDYQAQKTKPMYQLNYHSKAIPGLRLVDLDTILEEAIAENLARHITGCLIYHNESFVQILEGSKKDVLEVYEKIKSDKRHYNVTLIWDNNVDTRFFQEWNMAYHRPDDKNLKQFVNNLLLLSQLSARTSGSLLSFWGSVRRTLLEGSNNEYGKV